MADHEWHWLHGINPEPWTSPDVSVGRRAGGHAYPIVYKSEALRSYQEGIKSLLEGKPTLIFDPGTPITLEFYFWRQLPDYTTDRERRARKHEADATNMQKALEDALQGVLFENDRDVKRIYSEIMEQGHDTEPRIGIRIGLWTGPSVLPVAVPEPLEQLAGGDVVGSDLGPMGVANVEEYF